MYPYARVIIRSQAVMNEDDDYYYYFYDSSKKDHITGKEQYGDEEDEKGGFRSLYDDVVEMKTALATLTKRYSEG